MIRLATSTRDSFAAGGRINGLAMSWDTSLLNPSGIGEEVVRFCADFVFLRRVLFIGKQVG